MSLREKTNRRLERIIGRFVDIFYIPIVARFVPHQLFRYMACGGANVMFDLCLYAVLYNFVLNKQIVELGFVAISPHIAAFLIVFPITFLTGFWLARHISFASSPLRERTQLFRYMLSVAGSILLNYILLKLFVEACGIYPTPSKALTTIFVTAYSYLMQKHFTFRGNRGVSA